MGYGFSSPAFLDCSSVSILNIGNQVKTIPSYAFSGCSNLTTVNFNADSCISIGNSWLGGDTLFTTLNIGNNVKIIPDDAFNGCRRLTSVTIGNSVTIIGEGAFLNCSGITSITIPSSVDSIRIAAFLLCSGLTEIYVKAQIPPLLGNSVFSSVPDTIPVYVPCGKETDYQNTSGWDYFTNIIGDIFPYDIGVQSSDALMGNVNIIQTPDCITNTAIIEATTNSGYRFVQWNDGITDNPRTITVTQDTTFTAIFNVATGIANRETSTRSVYPNPATDNINIVLPENVSHAVFMLYDMQGKMLIKQEIRNQDMVSINNLANGMYIYNVKTEKENRQGKIVKQ
jgi:hypothetical protein